SGSSAPASLVVAGGLLYFTADDGTSGRELWRSDGTAAGTFRLRDIAPGTASAAVTSMKPVAGRLFFLANDGTSGSEPWVTDGTQAGTYQVKDVAPGAASSDAADLYALEPEGTLVFTARDVVNGRELWMSDGTEAGTRPLTDLSPAGLTHLASPTRPARLGNHVLFFADDRQSGMEPWRVTQGPPPDTTPPVIVCPGSVTAEATSASGAVVAYPAVTATDEVTAVPVITTNAPAGGQFPLGATEVDAEARDEAGNVAACVFTVTVRDTTAPALECPGVVVVEAAGADGAPVSSVEVTATDAVTASPALGYSPALGTVFSLGSTLLEVTAEDEAGNTATCQVQVTVSDTMAPTVTCPASVTVEAAGPEGAVVNYGAAQARDAVSSPSITYSKATGTVFAPGTTQVEATATDAAGHTASCTFTVTVRDTTAPTVTCPADVTAEATSADGAAVAYPPATTTDAASAVELSYSRTSGMVFPLGGTEVSVTARDAAGNSASCRFVVTVRDTTAPRLDCPMDVTVEATGAGGAVVTYAGATVSDAVSPAPLVRYSQDSGTRFVLGRTEVAVTASDEAGNTAACTFSVSVADTTAPGVTCPADVTAEATDATGAVVGYPAATGTDGASEPTLGYSRASGTVFPLGGTQVRVTARDGSDNTASCAFTVTVRDTTAPSMGCPEDLVVEAQDATGTQVAYLLARPRDAVTAAPAMSTSHAPGSRFPLGSTEVAVVARDDAGNEAACAFTVTVRDTTPPALSCPADLEQEATHSSGSVVDYAPATVSDVATASPRVEYSHRAGTFFPLGTTRVTAWTVDGAGLRAECSFRVTLTHTVPVLPGQEAVGCACGVSEGSRSGLGLTPWLLLGLGLLWSRHRAHERPSRRSAGRSGPDA
ncbi:HYR domain-containing protein, partial [Pyxidicoccus sp. 3LG]